MSTWTPVNRNTASFTATNRNSASFSATNKSLSGNSFLLLESGFFLLLEDGTSKIILEQSVIGPPTWTPTNKS